MSEHHPLCPADTAKGSLVRENAIALCLTWSICDRLNMATDEARADERKAAARDALAAVREVEPVRDVDYPLHLIERREVLAAIAAALGEGE